uniref:Uncharacterized protein n=1 Tax=Dechloromonas aromatica (strain RCB) TaxID=159087 RepID=Q47E49_DECAR
MVSHTPDCPEITDPGSAKIPVIAEVVVALHPPGVCPGIFIDIRFDPFLFTFIVKRVVRFMGVMDRIFGLGSVGVYGLMTR